VDRKEITGRCRHGMYRQPGDPCCGCAFCTIDGNDYSDRKEKPDLRNIF
jgi:hypothetical protein